jgi:uncharacterized membrane protein YoaK (UPF0700 family)
MPLSHEAEKSVDTLGRLPSKDMERWPSKGSVETVASESELLPHSMPLSHEAEKSSDTLGRWASKDMERSESKGSVESAVSRTTVASEAELAKKPTQGAPGPSSMEPVVCVCLSLLAFNAGFVNVVCGAGSWGHYVTHVTGAISRAAVQPADAVLTLFQVLGFALGAGVSGLLISQRRVVLGKGYYGIALLLNAAALLAAWALVDIAPSAAVLLAAVAAGLQNGMGMCFLGAVVRTTHMTGVVTDIGVISAKLLRYRFLPCCTFSPYAEPKAAAKDWFNLKLLTALLTSFAVGSSLGAYAVAAFGDDALLLSVGLTGALGTAYLYFRLRVLKQSLLGGTEDSPQVTPSTDAGPQTFVERQTICLADVEAAIKEWTRNAAARDIDGTTALYDPSGGRLLGTVDEATNIRRNTPEAIREYFVRFLGGHERVTPNFPKFDADDVIFLAEDVASYSGYYYFVLVKNGQPKKVHAKFTYIFRKTQGVVLIVTHHSSITPTGVVMDDIENNLSGVMESVGDVMAV